jgi:2,4-dienoyl-CoA reductase-like NADH-dependent reductase (Old Yellow Enzyme family)
MKTPRESGAVGEASSERAVSVESLFRPIPFGRVTLPNRIVMAPMTRSKSPGKVPPPEVAAYYRRRAEGGVGLIVTEGTNPGHPAASGYPDVPALEGEAALRGWRRVVEEVHEAGGRIIPQLWHVGSIRHRGMEPDPEVPGFAPSPVVHPREAGKGITELPQEMTTRDIADTIAAFARAAAAAEDLGFDGVEIHGAHGYLIDQFFWEATNRRTDRYGGRTLRARTRFAVELIAAVRGRVGAGFPVVFRFSQWKLGDYRHQIARSPAELENFLEPLCSAGVDWFHCSTRRFDRPEFEGSELGLAGWTKKLTGRPTVAVGSVGLDIDFLHSYAGETSRRTGLEALLRRLRRDEFDLVAVGRALLADPEWVRKVREGREDEIVVFRPEMTRVLA